MDKRTKIYMAAMLQGSLLLASLPILEAKACNSATTLLSVSGKIARTNDDSGAYCFSYEEFFSLPINRITTGTVWTSKSNFEGPYILDVLQRVGAYGMKVEVMAENDYSHTILVDDFKKFNPILAYLKDGKRLDISDFGPLFLVYPRDSFPQDLSLPTARAKFVWNIYRLEVR
jgi:hypothetical protein